MCMDSSGTSPDQWINWIGQWDRCIFGWMSMDNPGASMTQWIRRIHPCIMMANLGHECWNQETHIRFVAAVYTCTCTCTGSGAN